jgi:hypothetical protein
MYIGLIDEGKLMRFKLSFIPLILSFLILSCDKSEEKPEFKRPDSTTKPDSQRYGFLIDLEFGPDNFPDNFREQTGYVLGFMEDEEYVINHVSEDKNQLLWFCKLTHRDESGRPYLKILDIAILPKFEANERLFMGNCKYNEIEDQEIVALVDSDPRDLSTQVIRAWRANRKSLKIEEIQVDDVTCVDDSFYL